MDGWFLRSVTSWFPTDDCLIEAEFTHGQTPHYIGGDADGVIWNWGLKGMMRLTQQYPIYLTAAYRGGFYDSTSESDHGEEHAGIVGLTFLFGAPSLKANNRSYAGLSTPMLPARRSDAGDIARTQGGGPSTRRAPSSLAASQRRAATRLSSSTRG